MDKKILHEIENYLHQIISHSEHIVELKSCSDVADYAAKIKKSAYNIDAMISDNAANYATPICQDNFSKILIPS